MLCRPLSGGCRSEAAAWQPRRLLLRRTRGIRPSFAPSRPAGFTSRKHEKPSRKAGGWRVGRRVRLSEAAPLGGDPLAARIVAGPLNARRAAKFLSFGTSDETTASVHVNRL